MTADHLIGLDFGGMSIKGGAVREDGEVLARGSRPFEPDAPPEEIFARAADLVRELEEAAGGAAERVGLGCAGLFERSTGTVLASANMPNLVGQSLSEGVGRGLGGREVIVENDANVAAFGEQWLGAGREEDSMALLTLGTGVGGGIVLFDELFIGPGGNAGEIGHTVIFPRPSGSPFAGPYFEELACPCGSYGCLERLVSASAAKRRALQAGLTDDLPALAQAARDADGPERRLLHEIGRDLGSGLSTLVTLFNIEFFVIGGGFGGALDVLEAGAHELMSEQRYGGGASRIVAATLGSDAGWIGAARLSLRGV
ncbi:MAG: ROK family protein [Planctomycetota bacterium]|jgi:glucokinase